ncbi:MAG TPA: Hsp20/alpha crystallin family protein [Streptosporangiaceae bacterium]|nr:Hsp20/alpha crystallin family protein [Streptosporangiaceae bacterium]
MYLTTFDPFARDRYSTLMRMDGVRRDGNAVLRFDVPGIDPESIDVTVDRGILSVSVKRQEERTEGDRFIVRERTMGTFTRRLRLSENLNAEAVEATYTNGVLEVRIPVLEQAKPRKVEVRQADDQKELVG